MPVNQYGEKCDIILNALGVPNRLNPAQLYEVELNFISDNIVRNMKELLKEKKFKECKNLYLEYIRDVNENQYNYVKEFFANLDKREKVKFLKEVVTYGISLHQPPFWDNVNLEQLEYLYDKYGFVPYDITIKGKPVMKPMIMGDIYMMRLKHEPKGKLSARSTSFINMKNAPSKSLAYKNGYEPYSKTPIRLGEMEQVGLLLTKNGKLLSKFNSVYSNNELNRQYLSKTLLTDKNILNLEKIELPNEVNSSKTILDVLFKSIGIKLNPIFKDKE